MSRMRLFAFALPLWLAICPPLLAADNVAVRVTLNPNQGVVIGQHVRLLVDVLFAGEMPYPPRVAMPAVPGTQVFRFETQAVTMNDRIDATDYIGKRFEFALYPRRGGELMVPPVNVTLLDRQQNETGTVIGQSAHMQVVVPRGVDASQPVVAAIDVTMTEQWSPTPTGSFKTGDALRRTVTRRADDVPGLAMTALPFTAPDGVRVYVDAPQIQDKIDRGSVTGERVDRVTYVFEQSGSFTLPGLSQQWWDIDGKTARVLTVAGTTVTAIAAQPSEVTRHGRSAKFWALLAAAFAAISAATVAGWRLWPRAAAYGAELHRLRAASEPVAFRALSRACRSGDVAAIYRALTTWKQRLAARQLTLPQIDEALSQTDAARLITALEYCLFGGSGTDAWAAAQGDQLAMTLRLARAVMLDRRQPHRRPSRLPPLNPEAPTLSR